MDMFNIHKLGSVRCHENSTSNEYNSNKIGALGPPSENEITRKQYSSSFTFGPVTPKGRVVINISFKEMCEEGLK